jgi:hypothetical protein
MNGPGDLAGCGRIEASDLDYKEKSNPFWHECSTKGLFDWPLCNLRLNFRPRWVSDTPTLFLEESLPRIYDMGPEWIEFLVGSKDQ